MADSGVEAKGSGKVTVAVFPDKYFAEATLRLAFDSAKKFSIDEKGAKASHTKANAPLDYVTQLQADLIVLGYLGKGADNGVYDAKTKRAVLIFQRHAARVYRMPGPSDVATDKVFGGASDGVCDQATAKEIQVWVGSKFVRPVGRFNVRTLNVPGATTKRLREDAADEWEAIVADVASQGGILTAESNGYGDTQRTLQKKVATGKPGASAFSFHFCGRAVDIDQGFGGGGKKQRYFIKREDSGTQTFWRLFCKTDLQDGTQGVEFKKGDFDRMTDMQNLKSAPIPAGHYLDMTAVIESRGTFKRIPAQGGFDDTALAGGTRYNKTEWWHFQYTVDVQKTFQDELELIGITEKQLNDAGWTTDAELDHPPG